MVKKTKANHGCWLIWLRRWGVLFRWLPGAGCWAENTGAVLAGPVMWGVSPPSTTIWSGVFGQPAAPGLMPLLVTQCVLGGRGGGEGGWLWTTAKLLPSGAQGTKRERGLTIQGEGSQAQLRPEVQPLEAREGSTGGRVLNCPSRRVRMSKRQQRHSGRGQQARRPGTLGN